MMFASGICAFRVLVSFLSDVCERSPLCASPSHAYCMHRGVLEYFRVLNVFWALAYGVSSKGCVVFRCMLADFHTAENN